MTQAFSESCASFSPSIPWYEGHTACGQPAPLLFRAMVTVPANDLIRRTIEPLEA